MNGVSTVVADETPAHGGCVLDNSFYAPRAADIADFCKQLGIDTPFKKSKDEMMTTETNANKIPHLRFPDFEGEWSLMRMKDITTINQGLQIAISERYTERISVAFDSKVNHATRG